MRTATHLTPNLQAEDHKAVTVFVIDTAVLAVVLPVPYYNQIARYGDPTVLTSTAFRVIANQVSHNSRRWT